MADNINFNDLISPIDDAANRVKNQLDKITEAGSAMNVSDMFKMQFDMNRLSQICESTSSVVGAMHSAISTLARNTKG